MQCPFVFVRATSMMEEWQNWSTVNECVCVIWMYLKLEALIMTCFLIFNLIYTWEDPQSSQSEWRVNRTLMSESLLLKTEEHRDKASWSIPGQYACFPWSNKPTCEVHRIDLQIWNLTTSHRNSLAPVSLNQELGTQPRMLDSAWFKSCGLWIRNDHTNGTMFTLMI